MGDGGRFQPLIFQGVSPTESSPQSKDLFIQTTFGVKCEWWVWLEPWIPEWPWLSFPPSPWKDNMTARVMCLPMFSLNFPIFVWLYPQSHELARASSTNCWCLPQLYRHIYILYIFDSNSLKVHSYWAMRLASSNPCEEISLWMTSPRCLDVNRVGGHMCSLTNPTIEPCQDATPTSWMPKL